jgi:Tol biopolymer transport system component
MRMFASGITAYQWDTSAKDDASRRRLMFPIDGKIGIYDSSNTSAPISIIYDGSWLTSPSAGKHESYPALVPVLSPDGKKIAFVLHRDIYILYVYEQGRVIRVTSSGEEDGISCGLADYLAQEEMDRFVRETRAVAKIA